ncbi:hypothetical protein MRX96_029455 [Rhipicephalus microplus]
MPVASSAPTATATKEEPPHAYRSRHTKKGTLVPSLLFPFACTVIESCGREGEKKKLREYNYVVSAKELVQCFQLDFRYLYNAVTSREPLAIKVQRRVESNQHHLFCCLLYIVRTTGDIAAHVSTLLA